MAVAQQAPHALQGLLEILRVGRAPGVKDHQIRSNPLQAPVLVGPQELAHDVALLFAFDLHQGDGEVAGDAVGPEPRGAPSVRGQDLRRRARFGFGVEQAIGQTLEQMGLVLGDAEVVQLVKALTGANSTGKVAFGTEAGLFQEMAGIPTVVCGPGSIEQAHKPDEFIALDQVAACEEFIRKLFARCWT